MSIACHAEIAAAPMEIRNGEQKMASRGNGVDVLVSQGQAMADAIRQIGVSEVTYYRWRQEFGGLRSSR